MEGQPHRSIEQNRETRNRSTQICSTYFGKKCKSNFIEKRYPFQQMALEQLDTRSGGEREGGRKNSRKKGRSLELSGRS